MLSKLSNAGMLILLWSLVCLPVFGLSQTPYFLIIESAPAAAVDGIVYRFYVQSETATDKVSAVCGTNEEPLFIDTPEGIFNSSFNTSWSASGINPAFLAIVPEMADDSYATIGLEGPASTSGIEGAADPCIAEDATQPLTPFFLNNGATQLVADQIIGSSWFVLNTAGNALPDANGQSLLLQIIPEGAGSLEDVQNSFVFDGPGIYAPVGEGNPCGCTDPEAENFDPTAGYDDGSCIVAETFGCTDSASCNFNEEAEIDDGSCEDLDALDVCGGDCLADEDVDGVCDDVDPCVGSPEECCSDFNQNGLCDATETVGCTFPGAPNYQPEATMDNGTCISSCYGNLNGDGHIQLSDLLDLLQGFGLYCDEID